MTSQTLIQDATRDGLTLAPTERGTLRVGGPKAAIAKWAPILKERKAEVLAALAANDAHPIPPHGDNKTASHWCITEDGLSCELWVSPSETLEQVQVRHPGAIPLPNSVTVTEPGTEGERQAVAYAEKIQAIREQGRVPDSYTATTFCEQCGPVFIFESAPPRVIACPWCFNRARGLPIPRPKVSCASCALWRPDPGERGALVSCEHAKAQYPYEKRPCAFWHPQETGIIRYSNETSPSND